MIFIYDAAGKLIEERSASSGALITSYVYAGSRLLSTETYATSTTTYMTADHLGSPRINTDGSGSVVARHDYLPFGEEIFAALTSQRTSGVGYVGDAVRKQFTGYERDGETGQDFAEARYFVNAAGRFQSPDPLMASAEISEPQTFNRYAYVANNPLNYTDSSGMKADEGKQSGCPEGKICDENGKVIEVKEGTVITGSVGVVDVKIPVDAPVEAPPLKIPGNTPIVETPWWLIRFGRAIKTGAELTGKGVVRLGGAALIILTNPLPNPGCDFGVYNSDTGECRGGPLKPEIDTSANPNASDNVPKTDMTVSPTLGKDRTLRPDTEFKDLPDTEITRRRREAPRGPERKRLEREEKYRKIRNKQKRGNK